MATQLQPPPDGNVSRAPSMIAMWVAEPAIATIFTLIRAYGRLSIRSFGWDDYTMFVTTVLYIALAACVCVMAANGGAQHAYYVEPQQLSLIVKIGFANQALATTAQGLSKISVALLLLRLLRSTSHPARKIALWVGIAITAANTIVQVIVTFFQCQDPRALWDPEVAKTTTCWAPYVQPDIAFYTSSWNTFMDFALALLPVTIVWDLRMPKGRKAVIALLLGLGCLSGVFAAIKTSLLAELASRQDQLWEEYTLYAWVNAEMFVVIVCSNIGTMKIFYDKYVQHQGAGSGYLSFRNMLRWPRSTGHSGINKQSDFDSKGFNFSASGKKNSGYSKTGEGSDYVLSNIQNTTHSTRIDSHVVDDKWSERSGGEGTLSDQPNPGLTGIQVKHEFEVV